MSCDGSTTARMWLTRCLRRKDVVVIEARERGGGSGCRVWECNVRGAVPVVLKLYRPGADDYSRLGAVETARKHALALQEMPAHGVPTPSLLGFACIKGEAALVMEKMMTLPFTSAHRVEAARVLARLHTVQLFDLSPGLSDLISRSMPNRGRVGEAPDEPPLREITLQHGDYFSVNLAATREGVRVLDWDLVALGDPMWDLGFLLSADKGVCEVEATAVVGAYREVRPVDEKRLTWQRRCWKAYWDLRDPVRRAT